MIEATREAATGILALEVTDDKGVSYRAKLEQRAKNGTRPPELDPPPIPDAALVAWVSWVDLNSGRTSNGMGPSPISWLDMDAWTRMRGRKPTFTELELIRAIDRAFLETQAKEK